MGLEMGVFVDGWVWVMVSEIGDGAEICDRVWRWVGSEMEFSRDKWVWVRRLER